MRPADIGVEHGLEAGDILVHGCSGGEGAGVVDDDVDRPGLLDESIDRIQVAQVSGNELDAALVAQRGKCRLTPFPGPVR